MKNAQYCLKDGAEQNIFIYMIHIVIYSSSHDTLFRNTEAPKVLNNMPRNPPYCPFISFFSLTLSIDKVEVSSDFMILIISSISSLKLIQVIPFPALATSYPRIFLWTTPSITEAGAIVANGARIFSGKRIQTFINGPAFTISPLNYFKQFCFAKFYIRWYFVWKSISYSLS